MASLTEYAIGSLADYNALSASTQARFASRFDDLEAALTDIYNGGAFKTEGANSFNLIYIASMTDSGSYSLLTENTTGGGSSTISIQGLTGNEVVDMDSAPTIDKGTYFTVYEIGAKGGGESIVTEIKNITFIRAHTAFSNTGWFDLGVLDYKTELHMENVRIIDYETVSSIVYCLSLGFGLGNLIDQPKIRMSNVVIASMAGQTATGIRFAPPVIPSVTPDILIENVLVYGMTNGSGCYFSRDRIVYTNSVFRDVASLGSREDYTAFFGDDSAWRNITFEACADSDGTLIYGTGTVNNVVPADEFVSLTYGETDFLRLKRGTVSADSGASPNRGRAPLSVKFNGSVLHSAATGVLYKSGVKPTLSDVDLAGQARPGTDGLYSIGPYERDYTFPSGQVLS